MLSRANVVWFVAVFMIALYGSGAGEIQMSENLSKSQSFFKKKIKGFWSYLTSRLFGDSANDPLDPFHPDFQLHFCTCFFFRSKSLYT